MKNVYGYIRVSDKKQVEGVSLTEQKRILLEYAKTNQLKIIHFFEEKKTAAKRGRPLFNEMMQNLIDKKAEGVVIHKIDRGSRNLHDWADIGDLIDNNIEVYFAHENLNLSERGGRLSADIQAVMASDYVRNLRQEAIKGLYGRLKQGLYPWNAPIGYLNNGKGKPKTICPRQGVLIKQLFNLYITGEYDFKRLSPERQKRGLTNHKDNKVCKNGIAKILNNPFYMGIIQLREQTFTGIHEPLITSDIFKSAQLIIKGRQKRKGIKHNYQFSQMIKCHECNHVMTGELQKGTVYYRCHIKTCPMKTIREDTLEYYVKNVLKTISFNKDEQQNIKEILTLQERKGKSIKLEKIKHLSLQKNNLEQREKKLLDAYLENLIEKNEFEKRKSEIIFSLQEINEKLTNLNNESTALFSKINEIFELCENLLNTYDFGVLEEKREILKNITSNFEAKGKGVVFSMLSPFYLLSNRDDLLKCAPRRIRTFVD